MANDGSLKVKNRLYVFAFAVANSAVGVLCAVPGLWARVVDLAKFDVGVLAGGSLAAASVVMALNGVAPYRLKIRLLFPEVSPPDPSFRVFELCRSDIRVNLRELQELVGMIPSRPREQNDLWQSWYREYEAEPAVRTTNGQFLLFRDLAWVALVLGVAGGATGVLVTGASRAALLYLASTLGFSLFFGLVARSAATRFVCTVVAHACWRRRKTAAKNADA